MYGKAAHFPVGIAGQAEQGYPRNQHTQPSEAKNDPKQHTLIDSFQRCWVGLYPIFTDTVDGP